MNSFLAKERLTGEVIVLSQKENGGELELGKRGGGIEIPEFLHRTERYFTFHVKACEEHSLALHLLIYGKDPKETAVGTAALTVEKPDAALTFLNEKARYDKFSHTDCIKNTIPLLFS